MKLSKIWHLSVFAFSMFVILILTALVFANPDAKVRIGGSALFFNGQNIKSHEYSGPCPVNIKFDYGVISTEPTTVSYSFKRSDGGHTGQKSINITKANHSVPVYDEWQLGAKNKKFDNFKGWIELDIDSPNKVSQKIQFTLHCQ